MFSVFIVGTGRSGTHYTTRALLGFEKSYDPLRGRENSRMLYQIAKSAILHRSFPRIASNYYRTAGATAQRQQVLIDQHHPNLFFMDHLNTIRKQAIFVFPERPTVQVVASMLSHKGVLEWYRFAGSWYRRAGPWSLPLPNQFLGLRDFGELDELPAHILCAKRVIAHREFALSARSAGLDIRFVSYVDLVQSQEHTLHSIFDDKELAALGRFRMTESPNAGSLGKYREVLSTAQVRQIEQLERDETPSSLC